MEKFNAHAHVMNSCIMYTCEYDHANSLGIIQRKVKMCITHADKQFISASITEQRINTAVTSICLPQTATK